MTAVYDPLRDRIVTLGTCVAAVSGCDAPAPGAWALWFGDVTAAPAGPVASRLSIVRSWPNPTRDASAIAFTLQSTATVSLHVYDLSGRTIRRLRDGVLQAGEHAATWDGRDDDGRATRPGLYYYVLSTSGERLSRGIVLLR